MVAVPAPIRVRTPSVKVATAPVAAAEPSVSNSSVIAKTHRQTRGAPGSGQSDFIAHRGGRRQREVDGLRGLDVAFIRPEVYRPALDADISRKVGLHIILCIVGRAVVQVVVVACICRRGLPAFRRR